MIHILLILTIYSQYFQFNSAFTNGDDETIKVKRNIEYADPKFRYSRISEKKCKEYQAPIFDILEERDVHTGKYVKEYIDACPHNENPYIVGGKAAAPKEFPHMALIGSSQIESPWFCGGTLISDEFVLSAAHCIYNENARADIVRLGELDYNQNYEDDSVHEFSIIEIIMHENYSRPSAYNDIVLFKLQSKVVFTRYIRPACLSITLNDYESRHAIATGWGYTTPGVGSNPSTYLKRVVLDRFDYNECDANFRKIVSVTITAKLPHFVENTTQFCFGAKNKRDICSGDSGGPLQIYHEDHINYSCMYSVIGVTSMGHLCGFGVPAIFVRVYYYLDWIEEKVWPNEKL